MVDVDERSAEMRKYRLTLYVTGQTDRSDRAINNLRQICRDQLHGEYEMRVVDILERPQLAEDEKILATPMLVRELPPPLKRVVGDLSNAEKVLLGLDLRPLDPSHEEED